MINLTQGSNLAHDLTASSIGSYGQPAANNLPKTGKIWLDTIKFLGATQGQSETGHNFVENQQGSSLVAPVPETFEKPRFGWNNAHITCYRLEYDGGHVFSLLLHNRSYLVQIIEPQ